MMPPQAGQLVPSIKLTRSGVELREVGICRSIGVNLSVKIFLPEKQNIFFNLQLVANIWTCVPNSTTCMYTGSQEKIVQLN